MSFQLRLSGEEYNDFLRCLTNLKEICNDVDIKGGFVRQRSNDKSSVLEFDMTSILTTVNMSISDLKKKWDLLKTFSGQEVVFDIEEETEDLPGNFTISDNMSSLKFISPTSRFIDNKYMTEEELSSVFITNPEEMIIDYEFSNIIVDRIRVVTGIFEAKAIQVNFNGETASITSVTQAKDQFARFVENITTNMILDNCSLNLTTIPFTIEHDTEVKFQMYKDTTQDISYNKISTTLGNVNVAVYTRSNILKNEE